MPQISAAQRSYVAARWPLHLVGALKARADTRAFVRPWAYDPERPFADWRGTLDSYALADYVASRDRGGDAARTWRRHIDRWLAGRAPTPDLVRRTLRAINADWVFGLGSVGYHRHALVLIHALWKRSRYTLACQYVAAIFGSDNEALGLVRRRHVLDDHDARSTGRSAKIDEAARDAWRPSGKLPSLPSRPHDLADELVPLWSLVESAHRSTASLEREMQEASGVIALLASMWLKRVKPEPPSLRVAG
ncbi:MAG: hypothetical protein JWO85_2244 [Candidatus Eremiobacteraeota bacterium]|nr:hypothetical protein [Candidatus Eremiobacteraeota bacterium]